MSKLKCDEKSCKHNCYMACNKQSIVLDDDAICCSYQRQVLDAIKEEFSNDNYMDFNDTETSIICNEETCYFNNDNCCKASEVRIDADAWCATYRKK